MPILDPTLLYCLLGRIQKSEPSPKFGFLKKYLNIASKYIFHSSETTKAYIQFKKDLQANISYIKEIFGCEKMTIDFDNWQIPDYYQFLSDLIKDINPETIGGDYFRIGYKFSYFQPYLVYSNHRSWFLNNSPNAVLCINVGRINQKELSLILLEIDIMAAAGYTLILCLSDLTGNLDIDETSFIELINSHPFSEIHIIYDNNTAYDCKIINKTQTGFSILINLIKDKCIADSYFYLYVQYIQEFDSHG